MSRLPRSILICSVALLGLALPPAAHAQTVVNFEDLSVPTDTTLPGQTVNTNPSDVTGGELIDAAGGYTTSGGTQVNPTSTTYTYVGNGYTEDYQLSNFTSEGDAGFQCLWRVRRLVWLGHFQRQRRRFSDANAVWRPGRPGQRHVQYRRLCCPLSVFGLYRRGTAAHRRRGRRLVQLRRLLQRQHLARRSDPVTRRNVSAVDRYHQRLLRRAVGFYGDSQSFRFNSPALITSDGQNPNLTLYISGWTTGADPTEVGTPIKVPLAQFSPAGGLQLIDQWTTESLTSLSGAQQLEFLVTTNVYDSSGPSVPLTFAADNLVLTPEPSSLALGLIAGVCAAAFAARRAARRRAGPI